MEMLNMKKIAFSELFPKGIILQRTLPFSQALRKKGRR